MVAVSAVALFVGVVVGDDVDVSCRAPSSCSFSWDSNYSVFVVLVVEDEDHNYSPSSSFLVVLDSSFVGLESMRVVGGGFETTTSYSLRVFLSL